MAEVAVVMTGEEAKLWRAQQRIIAQTKELEGGYKKVGAAGKKAADDGEKAAKDQEKAQQRLLGSINSAVTKWVSVTAAVQLAAQAMQFYRRETDAAVQSFDSLGESRRRLVQVSRGPSDLQKLESLADRMAAGYGVDRETTRSVLFSARSEGFEDFFREIIASNRVIDPRAAALAAGQVPALFPGSGLTARQSVNAALVAATQSRMTFEQLTTDLPGAAEGAGAAGATPAETMALQSVLATRFKSGSTAADRIKALGAKIALDDELQGKGVIAAVKSLQASGEERRAEFLKESMELNAAFRVISEEMTTIEKRTQQIENAIREADSSRSALATLRASSVDVTTDVGRQTAADVAADQARIAREIANEQMYQAPSARRQAALDQVLADIKTARGDSFAQYAAEWVGWGLKGVGASPEAIRGFSALTAEVFSGEEVGELGKRIGAAQRQREAAALSESARQLTNAAEALTGAAQEQTRRSESFSNAQRAQAAVPP